MYYDGIDVSEGIDANKINASKKCDVCHYFNFKFLLPVLSFSLSFHALVLSFENFKCHA